MTEFENDKNKLKEYIQEYINNNKKEEKNTQMMEVENKYDNKNKKDKDNIKIIKLDDENPKTLLSNFFDRHIT